MAIAMTAFSMPGPSAATKASASTSRGKARNTSVTRIRTVSTPAAEIARDGADQSPIGVAMIETSTTTISVRREPWTMRDQMSRA